MPGPDGKVSESMRALDAPGDLLGGDGLAVLPLRVVADRERPLGEVVVGRAQVGRQVGDEDHLAGLRVTGVLGQRPVVSACWIELPVTDQPSVGSSRVRAGVAGQVDRDGAAGRGALDVGGGALALWRPCRALRRPGSVRCPLPLLPLSSPAAATRSEGRTARHRRRRASGLVRLIVQPFFLVRAPEENRGDVCGSPPQRRVFGSSASRIASPRRLRASTRATMPISGSHR